MGVIVDGETRRGGGKGDGKGGGGGKGKGKGYIIGKAR